MLATLNDFNPLTFARSNKNTEMDTLKRSNMYNPSILLFKVFLVSLCFNLFIMDIILKLN